MTNVQHLILWTATITYLGIGIMFNSRPPKLQLHVEQLRKIVARNALDLRRHNTSGNEQKILSKL